MGPKSEEDSIAFSRLTEIQKSTSSAIGWAIKIGKTFSTEGVADITTRILPLTRKLLPKVEPRLCTGYATLLYFCEMVSDFIQF